MTSTCSGSLDVLINWILSIHRLGISSYIEPLQIIQSATCGSGAPGPSKSLYFTSITDPGPPKTGAATYGSRATCCSLASLQWLPTVVHKKKKITLNDADPWSSILTSPTNEKQPIRGRVEASARMCQSAVVDESANGHWAIWVWWTLTWEKGVRLNKQLQSPTIWNPSSTVSIETRQKDKPPIPKISRSRPRCCTASLIPAPVCCQSLFY